MLVRRWTRAWIPGLVLVLLPVACKQEPTDPFGSSRTKDPAGHPVLGVESVPLNASAFAVAINRDGVYYVTTVFGPVVRGVLPSTDLSHQLQSGILDSQVRISPDGRTAYVNNQDAGTIEVIDVRTNVITDTIHAIRSILTTGISNDGQTLYSLTDYHGIDIISTSTLQITENIPASSVGSLLTGIAFHPTQPLMYVAARDAGVVTVVQIPANTVVTTLAVPGGRIQNVAVSRDGKQLFATDIQRSKLIVWDLSNENAPFQEVAIGSGSVRNAFDVAETPDGVQLYVSALADGNVYVLDRESLSLVATLPVGGSPRYIAFNASGTHAIIPNEYGWVTFVHEVPPPPPSACNTPQTGPAPTDKTHPSLESKDSQPLSAQPFAVAISRNNVVYITQGWNASAVRADLPSTALSAPFPVGALPSQVRISPDGSTAYVEDQDSHTITYIDVATNHIIGQATVPAGSILNMGLSRDGTRLYALTDYDGVYVIDVNSRAVIAQIPAAKTGMLLTGVAFHPFAACMYISARDQAIVSTIDLTTNAVVGQRLVSGGRIQTVAVSLDGSTLYGADIGRSKIVAWDLPSNASSFSETNVGTQINRNAFDIEVTPDNAQLWVSTLYDGKVYVFDRVTRTAVGQVTTGGSARYIGFTTLGDEAVIANESGWVNFVR
ncbi:MAG TPA: beta-propeller fold lactonase family protein [Gemmatimonadales bacterium]|nr:beta-propeller fold lactonase family protein [Gemmatimonadales bacterium]